MPIKLDAAWTRFKSFKLETVMPGKVKETRFISGGPNEIGAVVSISYVDGASWEVRISEISDIEHAVGYQVLSTEPAVQVTSVEGRLRLREVSDDSTTYLEWSNDFSNDADAAVILDSKYKKLEFFADMKKTLATK